MIFDADALLDLVSQHAERQGVPVPVGRATMRAIVAEAERLAGGRTGDEPAALFTHARSVLWILARSAAPSSTTSRSHKRTPSA